MKSIIVPLLISIGIGIVVSILLSLNGGSMIYKFTLTSVLGFGMLWILYKFINRDFYNVLKNLRRR